MNASGPRVGLRPFRPVSFGRFELLAPLAQGGMGEIYLARSTFQGGLEKLCVIKKVLPSLAADPEFVERFLDEARTLVALQHGSIAQVYDTGAFDEDYWIALEFVDGKDLRRLMRRVRSNGSKLPVVLSLYIALRVLEALAYAHRKKDENGLELGLVHRDVSPQNILVSYEGEVKVIDFGLAKSKLSIGRSQPQAVLGKLYYMPPEQARGDQVDRRSDVYALGVVLYELLAGHNPFEDVEEQHLFTKICNPRIQPLEEVIPSLPKGIAEVVAKALAPNPEARFRSAEQMRAALSACLAELAPDVGPEQLATYAVTLFSEEYQREREILARFTLGTAAEGETLYPPTAQGHHETQPVEDRSPQSRQKRPDEGSGEAPAPPAAAAPQLLGSTARFTDERPPTRADDTPNHLNAPTLRGSGLPDLPWDRRAGAQRPKLERADAAAGSNPWYEELGEEDRLHRRKLASEGLIQLEEVSREGAVAPATSGLAPADGPPGSGPEPEGTKVRSGGVPSQPRVLDPRSTMDPLGQRPASGRVDGSAAAERAAAERAAAERAAAERTAAERAAAERAAAERAAADRAAAERARAGPPALVSQRSAIEPGRSSRGRFLAAAALLLLLGSTLTYLLRGPLEPPDDGALEPAAGRAAETIPPPVEVEAEPPSQQEPVPAALPPSDPATAASPEAPVLEPPKAAAAPEPAPEISPPPAEVPSLQTEPPPSAEEAALEAPPARVEAASSPPVDRRQELIRRREALHLEFERLVEDHGAGQVGSIVIELERAMGSSFDRFIDAPEQYDDLERQLGELEEILDERRRAFR